MALKTVALVAPYGSNYSGLTLTYTVYNSAGVAGSAVALSEVPGTGIYYAFPQLDNASAWLAVCQAPTGLDPYVREFDQA